MLFCKYITTYSKDDVNFYNITEEGKKTLSLTDDIVPGIIKLRVDANLKNELENYENKQSVVSEYTPVSETNYNISCKIIDNGETIFEVKTIAGSRDQAKEIVDNWNDNANSMYPKILNILTKKK